MARELKSIDVTNNPDLLRLAQEVQTTREPRVLRRNDEEIAVLVPAKPGRAKRASRGKVLTREDPLFDLIGIGASEIPGGVSGKKHEYLLEAYRQQHR
jgi:hypothetical protein